MALFYVSVTVLECCQGFLPASLTMRSDSSWFSDILASDFFACALSQSQSSQIISIYIKFPLVVTVLQSVSEIKK